MTTSNKNVNKKSTSRNQRAERELQGLSFEILRPHLSLLLSDDEVDDGAVQPWQDRALCSQTDPEAFFPEKGGSTREAKKICQECEVKAECLEYALSNDERFGIWGGLSERERRKLKRGS